jgi:phage portal protein BeeE
MGFLDRFRFAAEVAQTMDGPVQKRHQFEIGTGEVDPAVFGLTAYEDPFAPAPKVARREAIQVPAIKRMRDLICGTLAGLPLNIVDTENITRINNLLEQPERNIPRSVTMARTYEDMLFEGFAWWRIVEQDKDGFPTKVVRLEATSVVQQRDGKNYLRRNGESQGYALEWLPDETLIRFDSPTDGILESGARAIRTYLRLARAADNYADNPVPSIVLTSKDDADPVIDRDEYPEDTDAEFLLREATMVKDLILDPMKAARQASSTVYIPAALNMESLQWNPAELQLNETREQSVLELARLTGIDPEDLGLSTTSRTYQNSQDRRMAMVQDVIGPYATALTDRLSMRDVTRRGYRVAVDYNGFLKADDKTRFETYQLGIAMGLYTVEQVAAREQLPEPIEPPPAPAPVAAPKEVEAQ